ncbi:MAG: ABC transporter ATP-binding protein [Bacilli bacterium]|nr:ABC transporter ATP-binding protein [Bacilli bacterium]
MELLLKTQDLVISYGAIQAVKGVNIEVKEGTAVAILGANGAGKSTILKTISGLVKPTSGKIIFEGKEIQGKDAHKVAAMGIIESPEGRMILRNLTVEDNLRVGAYTLKKKDGKSAKQRTEENLEQVFAYFPVLKDRRKQQASTLSGGEQQMLAIGRALMASPKLLILDEPSLGLAPIIVQEIFEIINKIKKNGTTVLIVEQNAYQTLKIVDYAYVVNLGKVQVQGTGKELLKDNSLVAAYLGEQK